MEGDVGVPQARAVAAMLDMPAEHLRKGSALPPLWHWFYFPTLAPASELGRDGHPRTGGFLPPVPLPRRMWAGGRVAFGEPLTLGAPARRVSRILGVEDKQGRSGPLVLVTVEHLIVQDDGIRVREEQDLIYRADPGPAGTARGPGRPPPDPPPGGWTEEVRTDPVLLFRFSALTFNGHRIHYDAPYASGVEGYPGLVVHGPLTALLLFQAATHRSGRVPAHFRYRGLAPLFCGAPITLHGWPGEGRTTLEARGSDGSPAMGGELEWAAPDADLAPEPQEA